MSPHQVLREKSGSPLSRRVSVTWMRFSIPAARKDSAAWIKSSTATPRCSKSRAARGIISTFRTGYSMEETV